MAVEDFPELRDELAGLGFELIHARAEGAPVKTTGYDLYSIRPGQFSARDVADPLARAVSAVSAERLLARVHAMLDERSRLKGSEELSAEAERTRVTAPVASASSGPVVVMRGRGSISHAGVIASEVVDA